MVNCASASGTLSGFKLLDILLMLSVGLLNKRREKNSIWSSSTARRKSARKKERIKRSAPKLVKPRDPEDDVARRKRRRNDWKTNQLLTRIQFTILQRERERERILLFTGKKRQHTNYI